LDRLATDAAYAARVKTNPDEALGEFELSPTERVALVSRDDDALRRLAGLDVSGFSGLQWTDILCPPTLAHCPPPPTDSCPTVGVCRI
jgi:hypothetical protein